MKEFLQSIMCEILIIEVYQISSLSNLVLMLSQGMTGLMIVGNTEGSKKSCIPGGMMCGILVSSLIVHSDSIASKVRV